VVLLSYKEIKIVKLIVHQMCKILMPAFC